jgi:hypothetical protein
MKTAAVMLAMLTTGGPALAFADPPAPPSASATRPQSPAVAPAKPAATAPSEGMTERALKLQGYRLSMVNGQEKYCRREAPLGSRLTTLMHCVTLAEAELMAKEGRETTEHIQNNEYGCLTKNMGGCGK